MTQPRPTSSDFDPALRKLVIVVVLGAIMTILDTTITSVAVSTLGTQFHTSLSAIQWVLTGYTLALSASIPLSGWAIVRFGPKTMWVGSLLLFIAGSVLCGVAWNISSLIAFRVVQGFGAGMILPIGQTMLARAAGPARMGRVMSAVAVPAMLAPVLGPTVGGLILGHLTWRWMFYINVPLCAIAVIAAIRLLPSDQDRDRDRDVTLDILGLVLLSPGLGALVYGTAQAGSGTSPTDIRVVASVLTGVALIACYVLHARRKGDAALVDVRLLRGRNFAAVNVLVFFYIGTLSGLTALLPLYFQTVNADSPLRSGAMVAPLRLGAMMTTLITGKLTDKHSPKLLLLTGLPVVLLGICGLTQIGPDTSNALVVATLFVIGLGHGMIMPAAMSASYQTLRHSEIASATTATNVSLRAASSFGVAVLLVLVQRNTEYRTPGSEAFTRADRAEDITHSLTHAFTQTYWWALAIGAVAVLPALMLPRKSAQASTSTATEKTPSTSGVRSAP
ncbi:EmrB/QacA subfamily drug resistance transporter [Nocardia tenerifensis]|uniref:EmrB/QacA subfamily drug resistance transporter n=1 Tax=Nocardia tenerifensis TaxID=228006 RepID=A0A318KEU9_9NOCA|nr:DHA2 family efflux MFS transporter permease subunit [Nocardia tenerifensis]PXX70792.1 EmrB/QacA subfamily drug resistance transporter [Nocardia tenerifensis]